MKFAKIVAAATLGVSTMLGMGASSANAGYDDYGYGGYGYSRSRVSVGVSYGNYGSRGYSGVNVRYNDGRSNYGRGGGYYRPAPAPRYIRDYDYGYSNRGFRPSCDYDRFGW